MSTKKSHHRYLVFLDLEMNQPSGRIIEVGAVVGDVVTGEIVDSLSYFVNPKEPISPFITELTTITDADVAAGGSVYEAYETLKAFCDKWGACRTLYTWGGGDSVELKKQVEAERPGVFDPPPVENDGTKARFFFFGHRWEDMKTVYKMWGTANDVVGKAGLEKALQRLGLAFEGTPHRARDDAANTWKVFMFFKVLMVDKEARPGSGRRPMNALEIKETKRREKIVAAAQSITAEDLAEVSVVLGPPPPAATSEDTTNFNRLLAWSEKAIAFLRERNRKLKTQTIR